MNTPQQALLELKTGNQRFSKGDSTFPRTNDKRRNETTIQGQKPFAVVLTCSDSRTPPEYIFDQGIGDLFVIRVAGNVCDSAVLASVELGVQHCGAALALIMGHRKCGIISMAVKSEIISGYVEGLINKILPSMEKVRKTHPVLKGESFIEEIARENARKTKRDIIEGSSIVKNKISDGELMVVSAYYDIENGIVEWLNEKEG